jgi:hypothetical protein
LGGVAEEDAARRVSALKKVLDEWGEVAKARGRERNCGL